MSYSWSVLQDGFLLVDKSCDVTSFQNHQNNSEQLLFYYFVNMNTYVLFKTLTNYRVAVEKGEAVNFHLEKNDSCWFWEFLGSVLVDLNLNKRGLAL